MTAIASRRALAGREISAVALGCMNLSHAYGTPPDEAYAARLLNHALDIGVDHLDTAALYGGGRNERLLGRAVMHRRAEFLLASKCVLDLRGDERVLDGSPEAIAITLDAALERLQTDHIDLYYLHRLDRQVAIEESVGALVRARDAGKIGAIGLSEMGAVTIRRAHAIHPIAAVQSEYSPISRNVEIGVLDACSELGIAFVAFSPVARGLLAGSVRDDGYVPGDIRRSFPRYVSPHLDGNLDFVTRFEWVAAEAGLSPAQLAIGWGLAKRPFVVSLPGTTRMAHLEENIRSAPIPPELEQAVDAIFPPQALAGARYAPAMQAQIDTETYEDELA